MAIGTPPTSLGSSVTNVLTLAAAVPAGSLIFIGAHGASGMTSISSVSTTVGGGAGGHSFTLGNAVTNVVGRTAGVWCKNAAAMSNGDTITVVGTGGNNPYVMVGTVITGVDLTSEVDYNPATGASGLSSQDYSAALTRTPAQAAVIALNLSIYTPTGNISPWNTGFAEIVRRDMGSGDPDLHLGYLNITDGSAISANPHIHTARNYGGLLFVFNAAAAAASATRRLSTLGVG